MKLLTLNTHSLLEPQYEEKTGYFLEYILRERPDLIALQEVNQTADAEPVRDFPGLMPVPGCRIPLKRDNHALNVAARLVDAGVSVSWVYLPMKLGYGKYDEGLAVMCLSGAIAETDVCVLSRSDDYWNWRTRMALGVRLENCPDWFYTVHMGFWADEQEPFERQWAVLNDHLHEKTKSGRVWLAGDFNSPAEARDQGYDRVAAAGWQDAYHLAREKDEGFTVKGAIDGWRDPSKAEAGAAGMRIDQIWCSGCAQVLKSRVVFSGAHEPVVSDHYGVITEICL